MLRVFGQGGLRNPSNYRVRSRQIRGSHAWMAVAPAPIICPHKTSTSPSLETIIEEAKEECLED